MTAMAVSVVVVNHQGKGRLQACLESVFAESPDEVLLVDSGSTDGEEALAERDFDLRLIRLPGNLGPSAARNRGLAEAKNELVLLIDNDVVILEGALERMVQALDSDPDLSLVQARSLLSGEGFYPEDPERALVHYDGGSFHYLGLLALRHWYAPQKDMGPPGITTVDCAISLCCVGRRTDLLAAGGYDESMFILWEDTGLSYALGLMGKRIALCEEAICWHGGGTQDLSTRGSKARLPKRRSYLQSRNRWIFVLTSFRLWNLLLLFPGFVAYGLVHLAFVISMGHLGPWLEGKWDLLLLLPTLLRRRRLLQRLRRVPDKALLGSPVLTFNPGLAESLAKRFLRRSLDLFLGSWFAAVRWALR
jgi:GT2 family glycosyltransferase